MSQWKCDHEVKFDFREEREEAMVEAMEVMVMVMAEALVVAMKILSVNILGFILQLDAIGFEKKSQSPFFLI